MTDEDFKKTLWSASNSLRGSVSAAEYKYPVLGLVFLKYVSDMFEAQAEVIRSRLADPESDLFIDDKEIRSESEEDFVEDRTFYETDNVFWVPKSASFKSVLEKATAPDIAQQLDKAMQAIESENPSLKGVLYREFSRLALESGKLGDLINIIARLRFDPKTHGSRDIFGEVYEYFLGQFAMKEGQRAGEFYTPKSVVNLLVEILAPFKGKIYDPACGSGGMFVQSMKFKDAHQKDLGRKGDLAVFGQEKMAQTRKLCLMNLAVHALDGDIGKTYGSTFTSDQHKNLRADYILANPPFNISNWEGEKLTEDPRWAFGIPPTSNANFAWLQHMWSRLSHKGKAGIVLANGSLSSMTSREGDIRKNMIDEDAVECMVALPNQLFSNTTIPACLWFLNKDKSAGPNGSINREKQVLFIDCRGKASEKLSNNQVSFTEDDISQISQIYHRWRGTEFSDGLDYNDEDGLCYSASISEIAEKGYVLTPSTFISDSDENTVRVDTIDFVKKINSHLEEQAHEEDELNTELSTALGMFLGHEWHNVSFNSPSAIDKLTEAIFESWFVHFDPLQHKVSNGEVFQGLHDNLLKMYPSEFENSEIGKIPKGWKVVPLDQLANYQNGLALQKFRPKDDEEWLPVLKIAQLKKGIADGAERARASIKPSCVVENGDVIFSWSGTLVVDFWCGGNAALNQHLFKVTSSDYPKWLYYMYTRHHLAEFIKIAEAKAVTMGHIKREHLTQALCAIPPQDFIDKIGLLFERLVEKQISLKMDRYNFHSLMDQFSLSYAD